MDVLTRIPASLFSIARHNHDGMPTRDYLVVFLSGVSRIYHQYPDQSGPGILDRCTVFLSGAAYQLPSPHHLILENTH